MLKVALAPGAAAEGEGETPLLETLVRQKGAGSGKELPGFAEGEAEDTDEAETEAETGADPSFAWFATAPAAPPPTPAVRLPSFATTIRLPADGTPVRRSEPSVPGETPTVGAVALDPASAPAIAGVDTATFDPTSAPAPVDAATPNASIEFAPPAQGSAAAKVAAAPIAPVAPEQAADAAPERPAGPIRIELPPAEEPVIRPQPVMHATIQPRAAVQPRANAAQPLAAPLAPLAIEPLAPRRAGPRDMAIQAPTLSAAPEAPRPHAVAATPDAQQPALDMRRHEWMASMVERIETMRDSAPLSQAMRETNIRLVPDALGSVDISIRQEGDRVHVRFSAENATARTLLTEAQPRLAELAESRGLRLGQTSVDAGTTGQSSGQRHEPAPRGFTAQRNALGDTNETNSDERIA